MEKGEERSGLREEDPGGPGNNRHRQHAHRLEGDPGGPHLQGGPPGDQKGRGESGGGGREGPAYQRREKQGAEGEDEELEKGEAQKF
ncbi:hypothetical protein PS1_036325 [Malus domestica]